MAAGAGACARAPTHVESLTVLYHDADYLVIDKPYDFRIEGEFPMTLRKVVSKQFGIDELWWPHRLDYATSGVMCLALNSAACAAACKLFASRETKKHYLALVWGRVKPGVTVIDAPIAEYRGEATMGVKKTAAEWREETMVREGETEEDRIREKELREAQTGKRKLEEGEGESTKDKEEESKKEKKDFRMEIGSASNPGRASRTEMEPVGYGMWQGKPVSKVVLRPESGRRHQLRLHTIHAGHPIVGDATYTADWDSFRMMLHAWQLTLPFKTGAKFFEAPDPYRDLVTIEAVEGGAGNKE